MKKGLGKIRKIKKKHIFLALLVVIVLGGLAKKAINEVSTEISKKDDENEVKNKETEQVSVESEEEVEIPLHAEVIDFTDPHKKPPQPGQDTNHTLSANEELFLKNVKERVLVLFEGS